LNGTANVPSGMPFIPNPFSSGYWSNSGFISDFLIVGLLIAAVFFFLLPSLTAGRKGKR
jgi:hypothetical protein